MSVDRPSSQIVVSVVYEGEHMQIKTIPLEGAYNVHNTVSDSCYIVYTEACPTTEAQCECPSDTYHEGRCKHRQAIDKIADQFNTR